MFGRHVVESVVGKCSGGGWRGIGEGWRRVGMFRRRAGIEASKKYCRSRKVLGSVEKAC